MEWDSPPEKLSGMANPSDSHKQKQPMKPIQANRLAVGAVASVHVSCMLSHDSGGTTLRATVGIQSVAFAAICAVSTSSSREDDNAPADKKRPKASTHDLGRKGFCDLGTRLAACWQISR
eukprot:2025280-Amphidinium_carterae.1